MKFCDCANVLAIEMIGDAGEDNKVIHRAFILFNTDCSKCMGTGFSPEEETIEDIKIDPEPANLMSEFEELARIIAKKVCSEEIKKGPPKEVAETWVRQIAKEVFGDEIQTVRLA